MKNINEVSNLLKTAREELEIPIEKVCQDLNLPKRYVTALENERWEELPGEVYVEGYLKIYFNYLNLDYYKIRYSSKIIEEKKDIILKKIYKKNLFLIVYFIIICIAIIIIINYQDKKNIKDPVTGYLLNNIYEKNVDNDQIKNNTSPLYLKNFLQTKEEFDYDQ